MSYENFTIRKSESADTTESNFGTSVSGETSLRNNSFANNQSVNKSRTDQSPPNATGSVMMGSTSDSQFDLYRANKLDSSQNSHWSQQQQQNQQQNTTSSARVSTLTDNTSPPLGSGSLNSLSRGPLLGMDSPSKYGSYPWASSTTPSSATNNYNNTSATSRDLWSGTAANTSVMTQNTAASNTPMAKMQSPYYSAPDQIFNSLYENAVGSMPITGATSVSTSDMDALALQLMQLNASTTSTNTQAAQNAPKNNLYTQQDFYVKWPSYSGQSSSGAKMQSGSNSQQSYLTSHSHSQSQSQLQSQHQPQSQSQSHTQTQTPSQSSIHKSSNHSQKVDTAEAETSKIQIELKESIIAKLENEVSRLNLLLKSVNSKDSDSKPFEISKNHEQLYNKLSQKLQSTQEELEDTKLRLEVVLTAVALNPNQSVTRTGRYDEEEIAHKIITKMQMLTEENEEMAKMLSYGKSKEKDIEIGLLRKQNSELKEKVAKLENKVKELKK